MSEDGRAEEVTAEELAERFHDVARRIGRGSRRAQLGPLSVARYDVLHTVFHHDGLTMGELAVRLGIAARSATDLVAGLEIDGFVRRVPHRSDRRKTVLEVTGPGLSALSEARRARLTGSAAAFAGLSPRERRSLAALLAKVAAAVPAPTEREQAVPRATP